VSKYEEAREQSYLVDILIATEKSKTGTKNES
jgi:hypothetical protein